MNSSEKTVNSKSLVYLFIISIVSYLFGFAFNAIVSQYLAPDVYGDFSIAFRSISVISFLLLAGTNTSSVKYISSYLDEKNHTEINKFASWNLKLIVKTFAISLSVFVLFYLILIFLHLISVHNFTSYHYSVYAFWLAPLSAFYLLLASYILSFKCSKASLFFQKMSTYLGLSMFLLIAILLLNISISYFHLLIFLFATFCLVIVIELIYIKKILAEEEIKINPVKHFRKSDLWGNKKWMKDSLNYTSVQVVFNLIFIVDLLIIEWIHPSENATGYYAAMLVISNVLLEGSRGITLLLTPRVTPLINKEKYGELQALINRINAINIPVSLVMFLFITLFSEHLLAIFGAAYSTVQVPLIILSVGYLIVAFSITNARILMLLDSKLLLLVNTIELATLILSGIILTYFFGIVGMSLSVVISVLLKASLMFTIVKKRLPVKPYMFP